MMTPQQIAAARERAGLTQFRLAIILGVAPSSVSNWEAGRTRPHPVHAANLERALRPHLPPTDDDAGATT